jgi:hypothetical protein
VPQNARKITEENYFSFEGVGKDEDVILYGYFQNLNFIDLKIAKSLFEIDEKSKQYIEQK